MAHMQNLPVIEQEYITLPHSNNSYSDETSLLMQVMNAGRFVFLARPRCFGNSLLVTTLAEIYRGNRDLFQGQWIEDQIEWQPHPVILLNFNEIDARGQALGDALAHAIDQVAAQYQIMLHQQLYKAKFQELITQLDAQSVKQGYRPHRVVLLIEAYDKPIRDLSKDDPEWQEQIGILRNFYAVLKASVAVHLDFTLLTSNLPRTALPIFPELNHLLDLTLDPRFAPLLGDTEAEMEAFFDYY